MQYIVDQSTCIVHLHKLGFRSRSLRSQRLRKGFRSHSLRSQYRSHSLRLGCMHRNGCKPQNRSSVKKEHVIRGGGKARFIKPASLLITTSQVSFDIHR